MDRLPNLLAGRKLSQDLLECAQHHVDFIRQSSTTLTLATIVVGDNPEAIQYHELKHNACKKVGIQCKVYNLPNSTTQIELEDIVKQLAIDNEITGIHIDFPLPKHLDGEKIIQHIPVSKDVDGIHPLNLGQLMVHGHPKSSLIDDCSAHVLPLVQDVCVDSSPYRHQFTPRYLCPCTPLACVALLRHYNIDFTGKRVVVIGRSKIVSKPLAMMLISLDATVTVCHSKTNDLCEHLKQADIVCVAVGIPQFVQRSWLQPHAIVLDIDIHCIPVQPPAPAEREEKAHTLALDHGNDLACGDNDAATTSTTLAMPPHTPNPAPQHCNEGNLSSVMPDTMVCGGVEQPTHDSPPIFITPVPGGIGPVTVAISICNVISAYYLQLANNTHQNIHDKTE